MTGPACCVLVLLNRGDATDQSPQPLQGADLIPAQAASSTTPPSASVTFLRVLDRQNRLPVKLWLVCCAFVALDYGKACHKSLRLCTGCSVYLQQPFAPKVVVSLLCLVILSSRIVLSMRHGHRPDIPHNKQGACKSHRLQRKSLCTFSGLSDCSCLTGSAAAFSPEASVPFWTSTPSIAVAPSGSLTGAAAVMWVPCAPCVGSAESPCAEGGDSAVSWLSVCAPSTAEAKWDTEVDPPSVKVSLRFICIT